MSDAGPERDSSNVPGGHLKIPASKGKLDEMVFGELQAMADSGLLKETRIQSAIRVQKSLLRKAVPMKPEGAEWITSLHNKVNEQPHVPASRPQDRKAAEGAVAPVRPDRQPNYVVYSG